MPLIQNHNRGGLGGLVFNSPFEIIGARWNSSPHQGNQNHNGKISKAVPAEFGMRRACYQGIDASVKRWNEFGDRAFCFGEFRVVQGDVVVSRQAGRMCWYIAGGGGLV